MFKVLGENSWMFEGKITGMRLSASDLISALFALRDEKLIKGSCSDRLYFTGSASDGESDR